MTLPVAMSELSAPISYAYNLGTQSPYLLLTRSARAVLRQLQTLLLLFDPGQSRFKFLPLLRNGTTRIPPGKLDHPRRLVIVAYQE